jgi:hypothetical protein
MNAGACFMNRALKQLKQETYHIQTDGTVVECSADSIRVDTDHGELSARRAVSCLIEPVARDRVLIAGNLADELFVIAVLERKDASTTRIIVDGDLSLGVPKGRFSVAAAHGVDLVSAKDMTITSSELTVRAPKGHLFLDHLTYLGRKIFAQTQAIKLVGKLFDAVLDRISHKVRRSYKVVEEIDYMRSEEIDYRAARNMSLRGQNTLVTAEDLVKIDADQIHLG